MKKYFLAAITVIAFASCCKPKPVDNNNIFSYDQTTKKLIWGGYVEWLYSDGKHRMDAYLSSFDLKTMTDFVENGYDVLVSVPSSMQGLTIDLTQNNMAAQERPRGWTISFRSANGDFTVRESDISETNHPIQSGTLNMVNNGGNVSISLTLRPASGNVGEYSVKFTKQCANIKPWFTSASQMPKWALKP